eukprot:scaffold9090_cov138-Isochrysis_galbana.AAC.1
MALSTWIYDSRSLSSPTPYGDARGKSAPVGASSAPTTHGRAKHPSPRRSAQGRRKVGAGVDAGSARGRRKSALRRPGLWLHRRCCAACCTCCLCLLSVCCSAVAPARRYTRHQTPSRSLANITFYVVFFFKLLWIFFHLCYYLAVCALRTRAQPSATLPGPGKVVTTLHLVGAAK